MGPPPGGPYHMSKHAQPQLQRAQAIGLPFAVVPS